MAYDYLADLNREQWRAIGARPLLVIAGAGTGKTKTLAHRVAHLIVNGVDPHRILLLTFSRRAAVEMTGRVVKLSPQPLSAPEILICLGRASDGSAKSVTVLSQPLYLKPQSRKRDSDKNCPWSKLKPWAVRLAQRCSGATTANVALARKLAQFFTASGSGSKTPAPTLISAVVGRASTN